MHRPALSSLNAILRTLALCALYAGHAEASSGVAWRSIGPGQFGAMFGVAISPHDSMVSVAGVDMGNAFMTRDGGKSWRILGRDGGDPFGAPGYRGCWGVCFDPRRPERIWIGSSHGLFLSTDSGDSWRLVLGGGADHTIHAITADPEDTDIVYAASGVGGRSGVSWAKGAIWKTTDGGRTWRETSPKFPGGSGGRNWVTIAVDRQSPSVPGKGHGRVYACGQAGFFVSQDAGETWSSLEASLPGGAVGPEGGVPTSGICDMTLVPGEVQAAIFATIQARFTDPGKKLVLGGVYASYDGGRTWVERNKGLEAALVAAARYHRWSLIKGCSAQPKVLYWAGPGGVFRSDDGGGSWRNTVDLATDWVKRPDFDGQEIDWLLRKHGGNFDQSYYNDYGPTNGLACSASDPNAVAYTDNAGLGLSQDGGRHWTEPGFEFGEAVWPGRFGDRPPLRLTHKVRSRGLQLIVPNDAAFDPFDPKTIAIGHDDVGLTISRDDGTWWEWAYTGILNGEKNNIRAIVYDPQVRGRLWAAGGGWGGSGHVNESEDGGRTFVRIGIPQLDDEVKRSGKKPCVHALGLVPDSPAAARTLYAGTDLGLYKTTDGGKTWGSLPLAQKSVTQVQRVLVDPTDSRRVYAAVVPAVAKEGAAGLYRSDDAGATWRRLGPAVIGPVRGISACAVSGTLYCLAQAAGQSPGFWSARALWRSDDHGTTWAKLDDRLGTCVAVHPRDPDRVYYVTFAGDVSKERVNVWRSLDGGKSWTPIADDIAITPGGDGNGIVFDPKDPSRFLLLHNSGTYEGRER